MVFSLTNTSAMSSLQAMSAAGEALAASQERLSTGKKLNSARDDGAAFVIATHIQKTIAEQSVRQQSDLRARSLLDVTQSAVDSITDILSQMKEKALAVTDTSLGTSERQSLTNDITNLTSQIDQVVQNSSFNGKNLLKADVLTPQNWSAPFGGFIAHGTSSTNYDVGAGSGRLDVALDLAKATSSNVNINWGDGTSYTANDTYGTPYTGSTVISHIYDDATTGRTMTYDITAGTAGLAPKGFHVPWLTFTPDPEKTRVAAYSDGTTLNITHKQMTVEALSLSNIATMTPAESLAAIDNALTVSENYATYFASKQSAVDRALKLNDTMTDAFQKSYGDMVDADMGKESANWQARQAQATLAAQSLSIATQAPKLLLSLFN